MHNIDVIITDTFEKEYKKYWGKQKYDLGVLAKLLQQDISKQVRYLQRPYLKLKVNIYQHTLRMLAYCDEGEYILIPLFVTDKNNKKFGENMTWDTVQAILNTWYDKIIDDYEAGNYQIFPQ